MRVERPVQIAHLPPNWTYVSSTSQLVACGRSHCQRSRFSISSAAAFRSPAKPLFYLRMPTTTTLNLRFVLPGISFTSPSLLRCRWTGQNGSTWLPAAPQTRVVFPYPPAHLFSHPFRMSLRGRPASIIHRHTGRTCSWMHMAAASLPVPQRGHDMARPNHCDVVQ
jgi:hypothetical protein